MYPTAEPTSPSEEPTTDPTTNPTSLQSEDPSADPTNDPTTDPTPSPTVFCESIYIQIDNFQEFTSSVLNDIESYQIKMSNLTQSAIAIHINTSQHALSTEDFYVEFETSYGSLFVTQSLCALTEYDMIILT